MDASNTAPNNYAAAGITVFASNATGSNIGISTFGGGGSNNIGINSTANGGSSAMGGNFYANGAGTVMGINSYATGSATQNFGVYTSADGPSQDYGLYSSVTGFDNNNYAVYGTVCCGPFLGLTTNSWAGFFDGDVMTTANQYYTSDARLKEKIEPLKGGLDIINRLQPHSYYYRTNEFSTINLPSRKQYGLVAQELETVLPELVTEVNQPGRFDKNGKKISDDISYKGINYNGLIPVLIEGMKEQNARMDALENENKELKQKLDEVIALQQNPDATEKSKTGINPSTDGKGNSLKQNYPNPFSKSTVIPFEISHNGSVELSIYSPAGDFVASLINKESRSAGNYTATWDATNIPSGVYIYVLKLDGVELMRKAIVLK